MAKPRHKNSELLLEENYDIYRHDRSDSYGGVLILVKKGIRSEVVKLGTESDSIYLKIGNIGKQEEIVGVVYRPPGASPIVNDSIIKDLQDVKSRHNNKKITVAGDFNLSDIDWQNNIVAGRQYPKTINESFLETFLDLGLEQINDLPNRKNAILEIFLTNHRMTCQGDQLFQGEETTILPHWSKPRLDLKRKRQ